MTDLAAVADLPQGTVTFLFTDLEGSTALQRAHPAAYREAVRRHHALLQGAVEGHGGVVFETLGDAVCAAFERPTDAVAAALAGQLALQREAWGATGPLRARMGVHLGEVEAYPAPGAAQGARYLGLPLVRCRLLAAAHGGQTVLSEAVAVLVRDALPVGAALRDLGEHRLKDLQRPERVFQLATPDLPGEFPPLRTLDRYSHNLPLQLTSFVGRERELAEVARLMGAHRLLTLTGPGGTGKTRLALQAAADALEGSPDGVWLAELGALADPALVPQAAAAAVGVREEPGRPLLATLTDALRPKRLLLVLDNCEHLLDACARLADALLRACPHLTILATSREALGIGGEVSWRVPSLALPVGQEPTEAAHLTRYEAVRLFLDRAVAVQSDFRVTDQNAPAVAAICARLDGIPLAIELAAVRVRALPVEDLLGRLEDRFRLLTGGSRTALERHQTLQAAVDWSYALLTAPEQRLFARLAVFAGGWTLAAAEQVCVGAAVDAADVLDLLTRLVDKSLVVLETRPDGQGRYRLLETLRQYARDRLTTAGDPREADTARERHATYYLALAEDGERELFRAQQVGWARRLAQEHDNLRAALRWAVARHQVTVGFRMTGALLWFWHTHHFQREGRAWLAAVFALPAALERTVARAKALSAEGMFARDLGDVAAAHAALDESLTIGRALGDPWTTGFPLLCLGTMAGRAGERALARSRWRQSLGVFRAAGHRWGTAISLVFLAGERTARGNVRTARPLLAAATTIQRAAGDRHGLAITLQAQARIEQLEGDAAAAQARLEEADVILREIGDRTNLAANLSRRASLALAEQDLATAGASLAEALELARDAGQAANIAAALEGLAALASASSRPARALRLAAAAARQRDVAGAPPPRRDEWTLAAHLESARQGLTQEAQAAAWAKGQAMPLEQAIAYALADTPDAA